MKRAAVLLLLALVPLGCGSPAPVAEKKPVPAPTEKPATPPVTTPATPTVASAPASKRERTPVEKTRVAQLFQVPEFTRPANPTNYNETARPGIASPPAIRLLGFSRLAGQLRALVELKGEILAIEPGDVVDGVDVVSVDEEGVSFQFSGQRWTSRLFDKSESASRVTVTRAIPADESGAKESVAAKPIVNDLPSDEKTKAGGEP